MTLAGKTAVITGASSGIGLATVRLLARQNCKEARVFGQTRAEVLTSDSRRLQRAELLTSFYSSLLIQYVNPRKEV